MWRDLSAPVLVGLDLVIIGSQLFQLIVFSTDNVGPIFVVVSVVVVGTDNNLEPPASVRAFIYLKRSTSRSNDNLST